MLDFELCTFVAEKLTIAGLLSLVCYGDGKEDLYIPLRDVCMLWRIAYSCVKGKVLWVD